MGSIVSVDVVTIVPLDEDKKPLEGEDYRLHRKTASQYEVIIRFPHEDAPYSFQIDVVPQLGGAELYLITRTMPDPSGVSHLVFVTGVNFVELFKPVPFFAVEIAAAVHRWRS